MLNTANAIPSNVANMYVIAFRFTNVSLVRCVKQLCPRVPLAVIFTCQAENSFTLFFDFLRYKRTLLPNASSESCLGGGDTHRNFTVKSLDRNE